MHIIVRYLFLKPGLLSRFVSFASLLHPRVRLHRACSVSTQPMQSAMTSRLLLVRADAGLAFMVVHARARAGSMPPLCGALWWSDAGKTHIRGVLKHKLAPGSRSRRAAYMPHRCT